MNKVSVRVVLDMSGSMFSLRDETIQGYNKYINDLKGQADVAINVSLTVFNTQATVVYSNVALDKVQPLTTLEYHPDGWTALLDAVEDTAKVVSNKDVSTLFVIITDGEENSSRHATKESIIKLTQAREKDGWTFVYLGANQDAWNIGGQYGYARGNTITYVPSPIGTRQMFNNLSAQTVCYTASVGANQGQAVTDFWNKGGDNGSTGGPSQSVRDTAKSIRAKKGDSYK